MRRADAATLTPRNAFPFVRVIRALTRLAHPVSFARPSRTQTEAATRCGLTQPRINDLLRGRLSRFSLDALVNIAAALGQRVHEELDAAAQAGRGRQRAAVRQPLAQPGDARGRKVGARSVARASAEKKTEHARGVTERSSESAALPVAPLALETPRLAMRMFRETDWDELHEMFRDGECVRYTIGSPLTHWQTWRTLASYLGHWQLRGYGPYAVVERSTGAMIGPVGLWFPGEWPEPEIKWSLARRFWGHGYATEAACAVQQMAAMFGYKRLISLIVPENVRSKAVARRLNGIYERTISFRGGHAEIFAYAL